MLTPTIQTSIDKCVLCWLATVDAQGQPNVSPKELFTYVGTQHIAIAQLMSPQSVQNVRQQPQACLSFVDVFVQKGYKIKGHMQLYTVRDTDFERYAAKLQQLAGDAYPFKMVMVLDVAQIEEIIAPSYRWYPEIPQEERMASAMQAYGVRPLD